MIDAHGGQSTAKIDKIHAMPEATDIAQLRSYFGMLSFYRKYLPYLATVLTSLTVLSQKRSKFQWTTEAAESLEPFKLMVSNSGFFGSF